MSAWSWDSRRPGRVGAHGERVSLASDPARLAHLRDLLPRLDHALLVERVAKIGDRGRVSGMRPTSAAQRVDPLHQASVEARELTKCIIYFASISEQGAHVRVDLIDDVSALQAECLHRSLRAIAQPVPLLALWIARHHEQVFVTRLVPWRDDEQGLWLRITCQVGHITGGPIGVVRVVGAHLLEVGRDDRHGVGADGLGERVTAPCVLIEWKGGSCHGECRDEKRGRDRGDESAPG